MKSSMSKRLVSLLLITQLTLGNCPVALAAAPTEHLIINQVYGGGSDGPASHSFIELYNPTGQAVDLSDWSVQYRSSSSGGTESGDVWQKIDLTGTIQSQDYYLIRCGATTGTGFAVPAGNQEWNMPLHNKGLSVALVRNQIPLQASVTGNLAGKENIVDLAACAGNDHKPTAAADQTQVPPAWEGGGFDSTSGIQSKKKAVRRSNFTDTDNSAADFVAVDYTTAPAADLQPHVGKTVSNPGAFAVDSLTLQPGKTTASINLNWYAPTGTTVAQVRFGSKTVNATVRALRTPTKVDTNKYKDTGKLVCKAVVDGLIPKTSYTYRISNDGGKTWSKDYFYQTPAADSFTFAFTSDPQIKEDNNWETNNGGWNPADGTNKTGWAKMMKVLADANADVIISAGDQVEDQSWGKSVEYDAFFAPEEMSAIAYAPAVGNHDRHYMFDDHFNLPNEMAGLEQVKTTFRGQNSGTSQSHGNYIKAMSGDSSNSNGVEVKDGYFDFAERREMETKGNYYFVYNNVLFITLNTGAYPGGNDPESNTDSGKANNAEAEAIVKNFRTTIKKAKADYAGKYDWIIVTHHKSTQTVAKHTADSDIENYVDAGFEKLMAEEKVDFVLGGHDHVYSRSYVLNGNGERAGERLDTIRDAAGVIYITGNCASDMQYYKVFDKLDKNNNTDYPILANGKKGSAAYLEGAKYSGSEKAGYLPIGNQEYNQEFSPSYVLFTVEGNTITAKAYNLDGSSDAPGSKEIDAFTVSKKVNGGKKATGYENGKASLSMTQVGRYDAGMADADGGVMEIVDYNGKTGWAYGVNGKAGVLTAIPLNADKSKLTVGSTVDLLDGYNIDVEALVNVAGFAYGDMTSVSVSPDGTKLAAAIQAESLDANGRVAVFTCNADGTLTFDRAVEVGVQPDMVTYTPDGSKILTANEGEARNGYGAGAVDPAGSVSIISTADYTVRTIGFTDYDSAAARAKLVESGVVLKKNTAPSVDLEPEYIACTENVAYVTLQEANAIAVLDMTAGKFTNIFSVGFEDYSKVPVDIDSSDKKYAPATYENLMGIRMPDALALYEVNGKHYLLTANEGDSRAWNEGQANAYSNEYKNATSPNGKKFAKKITWFDASQHDGLKAGVDYLFGGRSFTMFQVTDKGLEQVFDSGNDFEKKTAGYLPTYFNCSNDSLDVDDRSGKKGPEPETVVVGTVDGKTYAFVALERIGGIMAYDISTPEKITFVNYINSRDFSTVLGADDSPEGLKFIPAAKSPTKKALLLSACEVGGTVPVYELGKSSSSGGSSSGSSSGGTTPAPGNQNGSDTKTEVKADGTKVVTTNKTETTADGTRVETLTQTEIKKDGTVIESSRKTETRKDGSRRLEVTQADGTKATSTKAVDGKVTANITVGEQAMTGKSVVLPMLEAAAAKESAKGSIITVTLPRASAKAVNVVIPLQESKPGIVAVLVNGNGGETLMKKSVLTGAGLNVPLTAGATIKLVDKSKSFSDTVGHWSKNAVDFVTSRELFQGTSNTAFSPEEPMNRGMLAAVLYRLEDGKAGGEKTTFRDVAPGKYYTDAVSWANHTGIVKGDGKDFQPEAAISRQDIAVMLYRYAQSLGIDTSARAGLSGYRDGAAAADYAKTALAWAVGSQLMQGVGDNSLDPAGTASRGQVATFLMRLEAQMAQ